MPKIRWTNLPPSLREHLFDRVAERQIPAEDLYKLKLWRESEPEALTAPGRKISDRSRFVAKVSSQDVPLERTGRNGAPTENVELPASERLSHEIRGFPVMAVLHS